MQLEKESTMTSILQKYEHIIPFSGKLKTQAGWCGQAATRPAEPTFKGFRNTPEPSAGGASPHAAAGDSFALHRRPAFEKPHTANFRLDSHTLRCYSHPTIKNGNSEDPDE